MLHQLDWINRPGNVYGLAFEDYRKSGRHAPGKNNGFRDVQYISQAFASAEQAEVEE